MVEGTGHQRNSYRGRPRNAYPDLIHASSADMLCGLLTPDPACVQITRGELICDTIASPGYLQHLL